jgi:hypothetical protein
MTGPFAHPFGRRGVFALLALLYATPLLASSVNLAWNPNTEPDLAGYTVHYGTTSGAYTHSVDVGSRTSWQVEGLEGSRVYYFVVRAYNTSGMTSAPSQEVSAVVDPPPLPPPPPPSAAPTITAVSPNTGPSLGGTGVVITGTNFGAGASVWFGATRAASTVVVNGTTINAVTAASAPGLFDVRVTNTDGLSAIASAAFQYFDSTATVSSVLPGAGLTTGGTSVTITGTGFVAGTEVRFGGTAATSVTVVGPTSIVAVTPAGAAGTVSVSVTTPAGATGSLTNAFTFVSGSPSITAISPARGPKAGGTPVTITGANFAGGATVKLGGRPASDVLVVSATMLTAVTGQAPSGGKPGSLQVVDVSVSNPNGRSATLKKAFTYTNDAAGTSEANGDAVMEQRGSYQGYFAEGVNTTFFDTRFSLLNPNVESVNVQLTFQTAEGLEEHHILLMPPLSHATVRSNEVPGLDNASFSTALESDLPIVAERTVSWDRSGYGAHSETSVPTPGPEWYLAEGATHSGFDLFYLVQNPNQVTVPVQVTYLLPSGPPLVKVYDVPPTTRYTIWVDSEDPRLAQTDVSAAVIALDERPIIVERAMYKEALGRPFGAGHAGAGVKQAALRWFLAEGATGPYFDLFVLVANPDAREAEVRATFLLPDGSTVVKHYRVPPTSRFNIWVDQEDPHLANTAVSTTVESLNGVPVIVERAMWWPGPEPGNWHEAHNSVGTTETATRWAVAGGEVGGAANARTYILIANTSPFADEARVTLIFEDGTRTTRTFSLPPNSRFNVSAIDQFPETNGRRFGALVEMLGTNGTSAQVVVERAIYWDANGVTWAAGTNAVGTPLPD